MTDNRKPELVTDNRELLLDKLIRQKRDKTGEIYSELDIVVVPRASRSEVAGIYDERLKIRLAAAPVEGEANTELFTFLSGLFRISRKSLELKAGQISRRKTVIIRGLATEEAVRVLSNALKHGK